MNLSQSVPSIGYVKDTGTPMGRGVFAPRPIEADELIEVCPIVRLTTPYEKLPRELKNMVFDWASLAQARNVKALVLGYGSIYNHANPANARYKADPSGECLVFTAARRIEAEEEITVNYNGLAGEPCSTEENWFSRRGIPLHDASSGR